MDKLQKLLEKGVGSLISFDSSLFRGLGNVRAAPGSFDAYRVLGLDKGAPDEEIKRRFRELARILHPDTASCSGTEFLFSLVNVSYQVIARERGWL
ncbi:MAG: J domain-containing protein [Chloroflexi bacterium]|nr:J domain-containing protein [Chloroflexota bacterium]